jgi:hypothetical protein
MKNTLMSTTIAPLSIALSIVTGAFAAGANASEITISNGGGPAENFEFGPEETKTMGEVFTPPVSGTLTSFSLTLGPDDSLPGVAELFGGVGTWNGGPDPNASAGSPTNLYQSANVPSTASIQTFTFTPDVRVTAGEQYVAYLSVYGITGDQGHSGMIGFIGTNLVPGINYFALTGDDVDPRGNSNWEGCACDFTAQFSATFTTVAEPSTWALMALGFGALGLAGWRSRRRGVAVAV